MKNYKSVFALMITWLSRTEYRMKVRDINLSMCFGVCVHDRISPKYIRIREQYLLSRQNTVSLR